MAAATGPLVPGADRASRAAPHRLRRADLLHLPLRADGARSARGSTAQHSGADRARRARDSTRHLPRRLRRTGRHGLQHRRRAGVRAEPFPRRRNGGSDDRMRRGPAAAVHDRHPRTRFRRNDHRARRRSATGERGRVSAPAPALRALRAVRRPHRSRQGLRGADRALQQLRGQPGRRRPGPDGRQVDADSGSAVHSVRRPAAGGRTPGGAAGGHGGRRAVALREPVPARPRGVRGGHPGARQRAQRGRSRALPAQQRRSLLRRSRRVRRVSHAADRGCEPARGARSQRAGVRQGPLRVGRHPAQSTISSSRVWPPNARSARGARAARGAEAAANRKGRGNGRPASVGAAQTPVERLHQVGHQRCGP